MPNHTFSSDQTMTNQTQTPIVVYDIYSFSQYPWMSINFLLAFWLAAGTVYSIHRLRFAQFCQLDEAKRRNVVTYIMQLVATTVALFLQIYGGIDLLFKGQDTTTPERIEACIVFMMIICTLYVWELIYRTDIGLPLLAHHIVTILLLQIGISAYFDTGSLWYFRYAVLLCCHATTEQFSFIALYCYRMNLWKSCQVLLFRLAALLAVVIKTLVTGAVMASYVLGIQKDMLNDSWGLFWKITFPPLMLILYGVQLYAAYILITIGRRCQVGSKSEEATDAKEQQTECADNSENFSIEV